MRKIFFCLLLVAVAAAMSSCDDNKMCRCVYSEGGEHYFEADESENCSDASGDGVICTEE